MVPVPVPLLDEVNRLGVAPLQMVWEVPMVPEVTAALTVTLRQLVAHVAVPHVGEPPGVTKQAYVVEAVMPAEGV